MNNSLNDRGIIKWQPFNSCFNSEKVIREIKMDKERASFPILSEDQIRGIEEEIQKAFNLKLIISFDYYYDGYVKNIQGQIEALNWQEKKLYIAKKYIYFKQILKVQEI